MANASACVRFADNRESRILLELIRQRHNTQLSFPGYRKVAFPRNGLSEHRHHEPSEVIGRAQPGTK